MGDPVTLGVTAAMSLASVGLSAASQGVAAQGTATADEFKAQQLDQAATYGELKAQQTNAKLTQNLTMTLGNIDAVRAAQRTDPTSPTSAAVRDYVETTGTEQKDITVANIDEQARTDEASAAYMGQAASTALLGGDLSIAGTLLKGASGAVGSIGKIGGGNGITVPGFNPIAGVSGQ
jgi:hypothetical protein